MLLFFSLILALITEVIFLCYGKETYAQIYSEIYKKRESPDSKGCFEYKRAGEINFPAVSENF